MVFQFFIAHNAIEKYAQLQEIELHSFKLNAEAHIQNKNNVDAAAPGRHSRSKAISLIARRMFTFTTVVMSDI